MYGLKWIMFSTNLYVKGVIGSENEVINKFLRCSYYLKLTAK